MAVGLSDGTAYNDSTEWLATVDSRSDKQRSDQTEINHNETSGDFQSRFGAIDIRPINPSTMPLQGSTELTGAFKSSGSVQVPENEPETNLPDVKDVQPSFAEDVFGKGEHDIRPALTNFLQKTVDIIKGPGDAMSGKLPTWAVDPETGEVHTSHQVIEKATELAGLVIAGPAPVAKEMADGTLGSFMGVQSKTIDKTRLYKAQNMEMDGMHPEDIWNETQTFRGADSRWRQVILDKDSSLKKEALEVSPETADVGWTKIGKPETVSVPDRFKGIPDNASLEDLFKYLKDGPGKSIRLSDVLHHPELYRAYPWLKDIRVSPMPSDRDYLGMAKDSDIWMAAQSEKNFKSTLMHEVQHIIQDREGFARGGNVEMFLPKALKPAEENFLKVREETEADIMKTHGMDEEDIKAIKQQIHNESKGYKPEEHWDELKQRLEDHGIYKPLSNITKSEELLQVAKAEAFEKYRSLMGEVESRNVQARLDFDRLSNAIHSPLRTESMIKPRNQQILRSQ
jgi:hypothetical protein